MQKVTSSLLTLALITSALPSLNSFSVPRPGRRFTLASSITLTAVVSAVAYYQHMRNSRTVAQLKNELATAKQNLASAKKEVASAQTATKASQQFAAKAELARMELQNKLNNSTNDTQLKAAREQATKAEAAVQAATDKTAAIEAQLKAAQAKAASVERIAAQAKQAKMS